MMPLLYSTIRSEPQFCNNCDCRLSYRTQSTHIVWMHFEKNIGIHVAHHTCDAHKCANPVPKIGRRVKP